MYFVIVVLLMAVLPLASVYVEQTFLGSQAGLLALVGKWFVFWPVGVRLMIAGLRQIFTPAYTARTIFEIEDTSARHIVQELGFGNVAIGVQGLCVLPNPSWVLSAAVAGGLFYGMAGVKHALSKGRNAIRNVAMISDLAIFVVLAAFVALTSLGTDPG